MGALLIEVKDKEGKLKVRRGVRRKMGPGGIENEVVEGINSAWIRRRNAERTGKTKEQ